MNSSVRASLTTPFTEISRLPVSILMLPMRKRPGDRRSMGDAAGCGLSIGPVGDWACGGAALTSVAPSRNTAAAPILRARDMAFEDNMTGDVPPSLPRSRPRAYLLL